MNFNKKFDLLQEQKTKETHNYTISENFVFIIKYCLII